MSYKPTNEDVIAYLYGEMNADQKAQIDQYIEEHQEFKAELESMEGTRMLMGQLQDEEVPSPMTFMNTNNDSEWIYWRRYVAIAATFLLLLTFGKITGFIISFGETGFQAGFGTIQQGLDADQVNELLMADRAQMMDWVRNNIDSVQHGISDDLRTMQASLDKQESAVAEPYQLSDEHINKLLDQQKLDLMNQMAQLNDKMTDNYRDIFKGLIDSFSNDIDAQRHDDLRDIQAAFTTLENATLNNQDKVEEALFNLSQEVNTLIAQNNNK